MNHKSNVAKQLVSLITLAALIVLPGTALPQDAVLVDHVDGEFSPGFITAGTPITIHLKYQVETDRILSPYTGHRLYSPDGASWSVPVCESARPTLTDYFDGGIFTDEFDSDGTGADTIQFTALVFFGSGLPVGYDSTLYTISFTVSPDHIGKTICLDSSFVPPGGTWLWAIENSTVWPAWDGPYCFEVAACCNGMRGNVDMAGSGDGIDVSDVSYLVNYLFRSGVEPSCYNEANINGSIESGINVIDLVDLVGFLFRSGPAPAQCP